MSDCQMFLSEYEKSINRKVRVKTKKKLVFEKQKR